MLRQVERHGDDDHAEEEKEEGICRVADLLVCTCVPEQVAIERNWREGHLKRGGGRVAGVVASVSIYGGEGRNALKMNFSVGVNMYREKVTCVD